MINCPYFLNLSGKYLKLETERINFSHIIDIFMTFFPFVYKIEGRQNIKKILQFNSKRLRVKTNKTEIKYSTFKRLLSKLRNKLEILMTNIEKYASK